MSITLYDAESITVSSIYIDGGHLNAVQLERLIKRLQRVLKEMKPAGEKKEQSA
jgi:hypothetical protein